MLPCTVAKKAKMVVVEEVAVSNTSCSFLFKFSDIYPKEYSALMVLKKIMDVTHVLDRQRSMYFSTL